MNNVSVMGIVLSVMPIGEYDRRVELLTTDFGRITAFARSARKPGSSLVSATRVFAFGTFDLYQGKSSYNLQAANITNYFDELSKDMEISCYGFYFLELAQYFSRENIDGTEMLKLLYVSLRALSNQYIPNELVRSVYELKMLVLNGLCPDIQKLTENSGRYVFLKEICAGCVKALKYVVASPTEKLYTFTLGEKELYEFNTISKRLLEQSTDKKFRSLALIDTLI